MTQRSQAIRLSDEISREKRYYRSVIAAVRVDCAVVPRSTGQRAWPAGIYAAGGVSDIIADRRRYCAGGHLLDYYRHDHDLNRSAGNGRDVGEIHRVIYCHRRAYHYARRRRGEVATRTGAAVELVKFVVHRIGLSSQTRVKFGIVASSILICGSLGTMAGGNAIIVAVIIPVAAAVRLTPPTVAALMMTAGSVGLFTGPFTPSTVTILSLGGLSYPDYLLYVGLPMSAVTLLAGWVMAGRIQKMTEGKLRYDVDLAEKPQEDLSAAQQRRRKLSALAFAATIIVMAIVGVVIKAGFSFAIIVMLLVALMTGLVGGLRPTQILQALYHGCGRLVWMFILYWLYNPILELMDGLHAYQGLLEYTQPLLEDLPGLAVL